MLRSSSGLLRSGYDFIVEGDRGLASRRNEIGRVRADDRRYTVHAKPGSIHIGSCTWRTTMTFDPETLAVTWLVETGFAADGRETLRFVEGRSPQPAAWSDDAAWTLGRTVRAMHDATSSFVPPVDAPWAPWFARNLPGDDPVIGHGDLGPWNILARDGRPVAFIDWDNAGPVDAVWELAHVGWLNAQLHDDDVTAMNDLADPATRARQLALIVDGYGLERTRRDGFVQRMIEIAVRSARQEAIDHRVTPESGSPGVGEFPILWAIAGRDRAPASMLDHHQVRQHALDR